MEGNSRCQFSLAFLFALTTLCAVLLGLARMLGDQLGRLPYLMAGWTVVLMVFTTVVMKPGLSTRRCWAWAIACAVATLYGPYGVAALHDWLCMSGDIWWHSELCALVWLVPGGVMEELLKMATRGAFAGPPPRIGWFPAGLLSAMLMSGTAWVIAKAPRARWLIVPLVSCLNAWGALVLDAVARM